jgi:hypothetical protein
LAKRRRLLSHFDAHHGPGESFAGRLHRYSRAAQLVQQIGQGRILRDVDLKALERLGERILRRIGNGADPAAVLVLQHDRLQDVVDLARLEAQFRRTVSLDGAGVLEVTDAGGEQHDFRHRNGLRGENAER